MIYHIAVEEEHNSAKESGFYAPAAYKKGGVVHFCYQHQIAGVTAYISRDDRVFFLLLMSKISMMV
jgi:uncharacterized protein (DUF952 family)